jgi:hypothetical protein
MARFESICRVLRDLGIFLMGVAAITVAVDYLFIHPDPMRDFQRGMNGAFMESLQKQIHETSQHNDTGR